MNLDEHTMSHMNTWHHVAKQHAFRNLAETNPITQTPVERSPSGWRCWPTFETEIRPGDGRRSCDLHLLHLDVISVGIKLQESRVRLS